MFIYQGKKEETIGGKIVEVEVLNITFDSGNQIPPESINELSLTQDVSEYARGLLVGGEYVPDIQILRKPAFDSEGGLDREVSTVEVYAKGVKIHG